MKNIVFVLSLFASIGCAHTSYGAPKEFKYLQQMAGCYVVDYCYTEVKNLNPTSYVMKDDVYDTNKVNTSKEWITFEMTGKNKARLQHILFAVDAAGNVDPDAIIKHQ